MERGMPPFQLVHPFALFSDQTNERNQIDQLIQIPATHSEMQRREACLHGVPCINLTEILALPSPDDSRSLLPFVENP